VCKPGQQKVHGVARQEAAKILCELEANPHDAVHFTWKFNNTAEIIDIPASHFTTDRARSTASYTPMTELDYGTLLCWGRNELGMQKEPCVFHVIPAGTFALILGCQCFVHIRLTISAYLLLGPPPPSASIFSNLTFYFIKGIMLSNHKLSLSLLSDHECCIPKYNLVIYREKQPPW
jgi:hypothetical protein